MKNSTSRVGFIARNSFLFPAVLAFGIAAFAAETSSTPPVPAAATDGKTHTLFMGTDISIEHEKKLYRIQDVMGTSFIISVDGEKATIPMRGQPHTMKVEQSLKLTSVAASLGAVKAERAYTPRSDPRMRRQIEAMNVATAIGDSASLAMGKYIAAENKFGTAINGSSGIMGADQSAANLDASAAAAAKQAFASQQMADAQFNSEFTNSGSAQLRAQADMALELYDAIEVNFDVSSPVELKSPYVVLVVRYHSKSGNSSGSRDLIHARALDAIGSRPQSVHILQGGLPPGYELESYRIHLYNLGQEVATDVSPKRVTLTREEAFEYVKAEYLSSNKGATKASVPTMGKLGLETKAQLTPEQVNGVYFVKVNKDGKPVEAFTDEACSQPVDPAVGLVVQNVRFLPALEKGKRVDGIARLRFSHLSR